MEKLQEWHYLLSQGVCQNTILSCYETLHTTSLQYQCRNFDTPHCGSIAEVVVGIAIKQVRLTLKNQDWINRYTPDECMSIINLNVETRFIASESDSLEISLLSQLHIRRDESRLYLPYILLCILLRRCVTRGDIQVIMWFDGNK